MFPLMNVMFGINRRIPVFSRPFRAERVYFGEPRLKPGLCFLGPSGRGLGRQRRSGARKGHVMKRWKCPNCRRLRAYDVATRWHGVVGRLVICFFRFTISSLSSVRN